MADPAVRQRIADVLRKVYFGALDDYVDVADGDADDIHMLIVSGKRAAEKRDLTWAALVAELPPVEWQADQLGGG